VQAPNRLPPRRSCPVAPATGTAAMLRNLTVGSRPLLPDSEVRMVHIGVGLAASRDGTYIGGAMKETSPSNSAARCAHLSGDALKCLWARAAKK